MNYDEGLNFETGSENGAIRLLVIINNEIRLKGVKLKQQGELRMKTLQDLLGVSLGTSNTLKALPDDNRFAFGDR